MSEVLDTPKGQLGFDLGEATVPKAYVPDIDDIRTELNAVLDSLRAASGTCALDARLIRFHKTVFPQMANWLPEQERVSMRAAFAAEIGRVEALKA
ncbi:hypothetical protein [Sandarakinorhabdus sp.]|uniref:hypothetical protein n=1 Tax=Sandarakinorhabdus sp. TaxID=1916663 RepID=UPI00286D7166|nr:hypothetical protein [Sandarakinorhabdus sp.]